MVESGREYVLQWPGHAAYVTERFSGLLARQTLVDVTLICDEQKLRVHKLVLASCSLYFEEILAEDLEPEPIIVLRDLNFNILKAMIEFMYCGETTVSHVHLPSLLTAARLFKVKELESLVEKMVGSHVPDLNDNSQEYLSKAGCAVRRVNGLVNGEDNGIRVSFSSKHANNDESVDDGTEGSDDSESERIYHEEDTSENFSDTPNNGCLYEDSCAIFNDCMRSRTVSAAAVHQNGDARTNKGIRPKHRDKSLDSVSDSSSTLDSENYEKVGAVSYGRYCDFVASGCAKGEEECIDNEINKVGQCSKVYTHKKRKESGDKVSTTRHSQFEKALLQPLTSNRIDLIDESSSDETPVTLKTNLENESLDCILSFNSESIQSIVGCSLTDFCPSTTFELLNARTHLSVDSDEKDSAEDEEEEEEDNTRPVLRRSVRLNQQENEDAAAVESAKAKSKFKDDKKSGSSSVKLLSRTKRKNRELERRVPNVKVLLSTPPSSRKIHTRALRQPTTKLTARSSSKNHLAKSERETARGKAAADSAGRLATSEQYKIEQAADNKSSDQQAVESAKPTNTTASVNRALWGDMSDVAEDGEVSEEFLEYSASAEIPFAVGLLPLRAALERMQATLDHQPRKTRSSALQASFTKHESSCLKRKQSPPSQHQETHSTASKRQNANECAVDENSSAVCHIQITTSPPQCSRPRKRSLSDGAATLGQATINGRL